MPCPSPRGSSLVFSPNVGHFGRNSSFGIDVSEYNLEDLLSYDDLFLDYFNAFLQLPAFPLPLRYNRLTATFEEAEGSRSTVTGTLCGTPPPIWGATDEERESVLDWAKKERLPLFLRSRHFREYKLCKLLLRRLDNNRQSLSRQSSRGIRGYSQPTSSLGTSSSLTTTTTTEDDDDDAEEIDYRGHHAQQAVESLGSYVGWPEISSAIFRYARPGSRAISLPASIFGQAYSMYGSEEDGVTTLSQPMSSIKMEGGGGQADSSSNSSSQRRRATAGDNRDYVNKYPNMPPAETLTGLGQISDSGLGTTIQSDSRTHITTREGLTTRDGVSSMEESVSPEKAAVSSPSKVPGVPVVPEGAIPETVGPMPTPQTCVVVGHEQRQEEVKSVDTLTQDQDEEDRRHVQLPMDSFAYLSPDYDRFYTPNNRTTSAPAGSSASPFNLADALEYFQMYYDSDDERRDGEEYLTFEDDAASDERTEEDVRTLEGRIQTTLHQLKEVVLGKMSGMESFHDFLSDTAGIHLLNFWLDCEEFKDSMAAAEETEQTKTLRARLFRDIQDKYKFNLTPDAQHQIRVAQENDGVSYTVFTRTQYDVLRRLRSYWVPRYLVHRSLSQQQDHKSKKAAPTLAREVTGLSFLPSITFSASLPVRGDELARLAQSHNWEVVAQGGRRLEATYGQEKKISVDEKALEERVLAGLGTDGSAGGPFRRFLEKNSDHQKLATLLFWQHVGEYTAEEKRSADRHLRMCRAWDIYNTYIAHDSKFNIGVAPVYCDALYQVLAHTKDYVKASVFDGAKTHALDILTKAWVKAMRSDLRRFFECLPKRDLTIPSTPSVKESTPVRELPPKPWVRRYPGSSESQRARRLQKALDVAEKIEQERLEEVRQKKKQEKERKKREQRRRLKEMRTGTVSRGKPPSYKPPSITQSMAAMEQQSTTEGGKKSVPQSATSSHKEMPGPPSFLEMSTHRPVMGVFKKHVQEQESSELLNMLQMYFEIENYHTEQSDARKGAMSRHIYKSFLDPFSSRYLLMPDKVTNRLLKENERPGAGTLQLCQRHIRPELQDSFRKFWDNLDLSKVRLDAHVKAELALRKGISAKLVAKISWNKSRKKQPGRGEPTAEDREELLSLFDVVAKGTIPIKLLYFMHYLLQYKESDSCPFLYNDCWFYIETQKFKHLQESAADTLVKQKLQVIMQCFIESQAEPQLQIDIPLDQVSKMQYKVYNYVHNKGKDAHSPDLFDESQKTVFTELLPYWAGFNKQYEPPKSAGKGKPVTHIHKLLQRRLEKFKSAKLPPLDMTVPDKGDRETFGISAFSFSISEGLQWKFEDIELLSDSDSDDDSIGTAKKVTWMLPDPDT
ncbi:uncharacterized protein LOC118417227 [Branchiostoma floridae]|uniref:Uncharacterized protein LOC118417227 n=1 Tax=Branchiostoma floridae TaxID=7739 RepID=A0A9J7L9S7_BRAFL|nr:uncharacterized protein LOC118417227 [Branchiostoma floridae]